MTKTISVLPLAAAVLAAFAAAPVATAKEAKDPTYNFTITDPQGDDHGDGSLTYPLDGDFVPGILDLVSLSAKPQKDGTLFEAVFARPVTKPPARTIDAGGTQINHICREGFYMFNIDVYIDTDRKPGSGSVNALPGRNAEISADSAWERAVVLTPRPAEAQQALKRLMLREVKREKKSEGKRLSDKQIEALRDEIANDVEQRVFFPTRVNVSGRKIAFFVPSDFLGGPARSDWSYVVGVSGADYTVTFDISSKYFRGDNLMIRPLAIAPDDYYFGSGHEDEIEFQPAFVDVITPPGVKQEKVLASYDLDTGELVKLPGVVPAEAAKAPESAPAK